MFSVDRSLEKRSFGGWCAKDSDKHPFLQVDLKTSTVITALKTQGLPLSDNSAVRYKLNYSCDGKFWFEYQDGKVIHFTLEKQWGLNPEGVVNKIFYTERLRPEVHPLTLLYIIFDRKGTPFVHLLLTNGNLHTY